MNNVTFEAPRGMRDFYPEDMVWRNRVFDAWRAAAERFGCPQRRGLLVLRTMNVVFTTLLSLPLPLDEGDSWFIWPFLALTLAIIVWTIAALTGFRDSLRDGMGEEPAQ